MNIVANTSSYEKNVFGGCALVTPLCFNPSAADIKRIKGLPDTVDIKEPDYNKEIKGMKARKVVLLCEIDPTVQNPKFQGKKEYVNLEFFIANVDHVSESGKVLVIDHMYNSVWITPVPGKTFREVLDALRDNVSVHQDKNGKDYKIYTCPSTDTKYYSYDKALVEMIENNYPVRASKYGEVALMTTILSMSNIEIPSAKAKNNMRAKFTFEFNDHLDTFKAICEGDNVVLNGYLLTSSVQTSAINHFTKNGIQRKLGVFLYGSIVGDKFYQNAYAPKGNPSVFTFKEDNKLQVVNFRDKEGNSQVHELPFDWGKGYDFLRTINDAKYPLEGVFTSNYMFGKVTPDTNATTTIESAAAPVDDDLPF